MSEALPDPTFARDPLALYERIKAVYRTSTPGASTEAFEAFCVALAKALDV